MQFQPSCSNNPKQISNDGPMMGLMKVVQVMCLCHNSPSGTSKTKKPRLALWGKYCIVQCLSLGTVNDSVVQCSRLGNS